MSQSSSSSEHHTIPKPKKVRFKEKKRRSPQMQEDCIKRDGRCRWCGRIDETLVGHHIVSYGSSGIDELDNMITLCGACHNDVGNGYLDARKCNHFVLLADIRGNRFVGNSLGGDGWKIFEPNRVLERIMEENLV